MIRLIAVLMILSPVVSIRGQPIVNPRVRIREVGDDTFSGQFLGSELSPTVYVDEIGSEQKGQLNRVRQFLKAEHWSEAADMLIRLSESDPGKLVPIGSPSNATNAFAKQLKRHVPLGQAIHVIVGKLAQRAPNTLDDYRDRVDPLAKRWLEDARENRDTPKLEQLIQEAFHSSYGDEALLALGDWALECGAFDEARNHYRNIYRGLAWQSHHKRFPLWIRYLRGEVPSELAKELEQASTISSSPSRLSYIDSDIPLPEVWSRLILVSILQGNVERATAELAILSEAWPDVTGTIGGQQGILIQLLSRLLRKSSNWSTHQNEDWPTFAGKFSRNYIGNLEIDIPMEPAWKKTLEPIDEETQADQRSLRVRLGLPSESTGEITARPCRIFPIVFDKKLVFKDHSRIYCLDLKTGNSAWSPQDDGRFYEQANDVATPAVRFGDQLSTQLGQHRYTLCYANGLITATMGTEKNGTSTNSTLIGFDVENQGAIQFGPIPGETPQWTYHGAPIHNEHRCWVGMRLRDSSAQDFLACIDVQSGKRLWRTRICTAETLGGNAIESSCNFLLTKHENTIYVSSHLGTIAAVAAQTGKIRWVTHYPRRAPRTNNLTDQAWHTLRDLTPCLVHDDLLIAAPSDTEQVFALHKDTGEPIWNSAIATDATKILGVSDGKLILSGRRLWWLDAYTGRPSRDVDVNPFPPNVSSTPMGVGRGLLSAGKVYWPAVEDESYKIYVLRQSNGKPARQPIDLDERGVQAGNLLAVPGYLLLVSPEELAVFNLD